MAEPTVPPMPTDEQITAHVELSGRLKQTMFHLTLQGMTDMEADPGYYPMIWLEVLQGFEILPHPSSIRYRHGCGYHRLCAANDIVSVVVDMLLHCRRGCSANPYNEGPLG